AVDGEEQPRPRTTHRALRRRFRAVGDGGVDSVLGPGYKRATLSTGGGEAEAAHRDSSLTSQHVKECSHGRDLTPPISQAERWRDRQHDVLARARQGTRARPEARADLPLLEPLCARLRRRAAQARAGLPP